MPRKAIFLDRDGVINEAIVKNGKPYPPSNVDELQITHDALAALRTLKALGYLLIGATNQPDVSRGSTTRFKVEAINKRIMDSLPLDDMRVCYHDDKDNCACRKPLPGMLLSAAAEYDIDLAQSIMIGDRSKDIEAGNKAGCKTIWLNKYYEDSELTVLPDYTTTTLQEAVRWIQEIVNISTLNKSIDKDMPHENSSAITNKDFC